MTEEATNRTVSLSNLSPAPGSRRKRRRVGVGEGSGHGKTCGRGENGQKSRSGARIPRGFEGGQMPLHRRLPKVGFASRKRVRGENVFQLLNLSSLAALAGDNGEITIDSLRATNRLRKRSDRVKILGGGELSEKLVVEAHAFSKSAKAAIEKAGGEAKVV